MMEMEYKDPSKKGRWIVLLGVVLALVAGGLAFYMINNAKQKAGEEKLRELNVKAARALTQEVGLSLRDAGELLGASQEAVRQWVDAS